MTERQLFLDLCAGIDEHRLLGALFMLGAAADDIEAVPAALGLAGVSIRASEEIVCGVRAMTAATVEKVTPMREPEQPLLLGELCGVLANSSLAESVQQDCLAVCKRLAEAKAKVAGTDKECVGVLLPLTLVIVAAICQALQQLRVKEIFTSVPEVGGHEGRKTVSMFPVPGPVTAELWRGIAYTQQATTGELVTPVGAAVLAALGAHIGAGRPGRFAAETIGYGTAEFSTAGALLLQAQLGRPDCLAGELMVLETNIDDGQPQIHAYVMEKLMAAGVLDVWLTPVVMKKGRSGQVLSVLLPAALRMTVEEIVLRETTAIGCRFYPVNRTIAERRIVELSTPYGTVPAKVSLKDGVVCQVQPEFEDCRRLAQDKGVPLKKVMNAAMAKGLAYYD